MAELTIFGAIRNAAVKQKLLTPISNWRNSWRTIQEPFTGAWQRNMEVTVGDLTCYPALYACLAAPSQDIGKLPFMLMEKRNDGIFVEVENTAYSPVLRKPNGYQNPQQFRESWVRSLLLHGNTYVLKRRDMRNVVTELYVLDPCRVQPMVSESGRVYYQINYPSATNLLPESYPAEMLTIPASEVIHDRINCWHHQLIGVPPVCAAYWPALKNLKILKTSAEFFANRAQPGGILSVPAGMDDADAESIQTFWAENYNGVNAGKVAVIGADMKFTPFNWGSGADSQLVEQMKYSDEQICQPFRIKPYKIGIGNPPAGWKSDDVNVEYHGDALSPIIESIETLLKEGLGISSPLEIWLDKEPLWRMDEGKMADVQTKLVGGGIKAPNEGRLPFNLSGLEGGDTVYMQKQDIPLEQARKNTIDAPVQQNNPPPTPAPDDEPDEQAERGLRAITALNTIRAIEAARSEAFR